jgi:Cd2+/Zn2+-exporting ATPase
MCCAEEVATLKRSLRGVVCEDEVEFDVLAHRILVPAEYRAEEIMLAVAKTGMRAELWTEPDTREAVKRDPRDLMTVTSGLLLAAGFGVHVALAGLSSAIGSEGAGLAHAVPLAARIIYFLSIAFGLRLVLPKALYSARTLRPDMNLLMTVAVAGAIFLGEWFEAATVAFLFALSLTLEAWSAGRARKAVAALLSLSPDRVRVVRNGQEEEILPQDVKVGERFHVRPGERIGLDGRVVAGESEVNQAPITGESMPVSKATDDEIFAGTINGSGSLEAESTKPASDTTLARIVRLVAESQSRRSHAEQWVDRFSRVYTPVVFGVAILVAAAPPLLLGAAWSDWLYRSLVLLVIGCPCALVISTPVSIVAAVASAARHGVLVKGGRLIELPASIQVVALDKTGTITEGKPRVVGVVPLAEHDEAALLTRAVAIEMRSEHPIAQAIIDHAEARGIAIPAAGNVRSVPGKGAVGIFDGREFWLGSHRWLEERGQETPAMHAKLEELSADGSTVVVVGNDVHVCGFIALADAVRPDAATHIAELHRAGIRKVAMLTGDNRPTALRIAQEVGIDHVRAELLPEDKVAAVEEMERNLGRVAMVGDGVNDAPALARASLGIAMGAAGTDAAIETADIALMSDNLGKLAWLIRHSKRTLGIIRQNTVFALGVKAIFVALTFSGHATLWMAIAADMGASLLVVFNAMRLLRA